jgi:hypothetical protein
MAPNAKQGVDADPSLRSTLFLLGPSAAGESDRREAARGDQVSTMCPADIRLEAPTRMRRRRVSG